MVGHAGQPEINVTVVDDEPWVRDVLMRAAQGWDFRCQGAASAEEALSLLEQAPTPVVVTDIRMPGRGGVWLVREVHRRWPDVGIIVITAGEENDGVEECLQAGACHYFTKPIDLDEFYHALAASSRNYVRQREYNRYRRRLERTVRRRTRQLRRTFLSAIDSLVRTLEARDAYTSGHSLRVSGYAVDLARRLGLPGRAVRAVNVAAKLHDIGKVSLPETILNKEGPLTAAEFALVRQHPVIGERILTPIIRSRSVLAAIRSHHEKWDGTGYPDGLHGDNIPLLARVLTLADCFDAMTSSRAYRPAMTVAETLAILRTGSGSQFDPTLVPLFAEMIEAMRAG